MPYDRSAITAEFENISDRGPYVVRDPSDFRDEYSAYASFLGLAYVALEGENWVTRLTDAARTYLCSTEPDPEAFCRVQMSLFQYPAGMGVKYSTKGRPYGVQANALNAIVREVSANVRLVPLRVILRTFLALIERGEDPAEITLHFSTIARMFNTPGIYQDPKPTVTSLLEIYDESLGQPIIPGINLGYFKRNFHILEQTGLLRRSADMNGLQLQMDPNVRPAEQLIQMCKVIADLSMFYDGFEICEKSNDLRQCVQDTITSLEWGAYYDGGKLPANILKELTGPPSIGTELTVLPPDQSQSLQLPGFPVLTTYNPTSENPRPINLIGSGSQARSEQTRALREKANRAHARIVKLLSSTAQAKGFEPTDNIYVDLCLREVPLIVEVKSCDKQNILVQIRRGISQLYEYRYRSGIKDALLCLALEEEPSGQDAWLVGYLLEDRQIYPLWVLADVTLDGPPQTKSALPFLFP